MAIFSGLVLLNQPEGFNTCRARPVRVVRNVGGVEVLTGFRVAGADLVFAEELDIRITVWTLSEHLANRRAGDQGIQVATKYHSEHAEGDADSSCPRNDHSIAITWNDPVDYPSNEGGDTDGCHDDSKEYEGGQGLLPRVVFNRDVVDFS